MEEIKPLTAPEAAEATDLIMRMLFSEMCEQGHCPQLDLRRNLSGFTLNHLLEQSALALNRLRPGGRE